MNGSKETTGALPGNPFLTGLAALPLLLFTYMPRPGVPGAQFVVYPVLAASLAVLLMFFLREGESLDPRLVRVGFILFLFEIAVAVSFLANVVELRASAPAEIFRVLLLAILLLYGFCVARLGGEAEVRRGLLTAAYIILVGQLAIASTQIAGLDVFDQVYNAEKSRPFGALLRATGSLGNPTIFAWIVAQTGIVAFLLDSRWTRYLALFFATLMVVAAGSRSVVLLFPFMVAFAAIGRGRGRRSAAFYVVLGSSIAAAFAFTVWIFAEYLPYLAQLKLVLTSGSLTAINSVNARVLHWQEVFMEFSRAGWGVWLFGLGARPLTAAMDNDFLLALFKFGVVGLLLHLGVFGYAAYLFLRSRAHAIALLGLQYVVFALILGLMVDTLAGWNTPLILFLLMGMWIGLQSDAPSASNFEGAPGEPRFGGVAPATTGRM